MKTKFLIFISVLLLIGSPVWMHGQTINTTAGSPSQCPGDIVVPITVSNCNGVGAISLILQYDTAILGFQNYESLHPDLSSGLLIVNPAGDQLIISWASTSPANIGNGTLMNIRFTGSTGSSNLNWDTQTSGACEYSDANGNILQSSYINGLATVFQPPEIITPPANVSALTGDDVSFTINAIATGIEFLWYVSIDGGINWISTGNSSATLHLNNISLSMDGYLYRCEVSGICSPTLTSAFAALTVVQPLISSFDVQDVCPGNFTIPILTSNFTDVASFSLSFAYNPLALNYLGYQNVNPALPGGFVCNQANGIIYISWAGTTPVSFGTDSTLVEIQFMGTPGSSNLSWDLSTPGACIYTLLNTNEIISVFENNSLTVYSTPQISSHPSDQIIPENTNTSFQVLATGSGISYQWQSSNDGGANWSDVSGKTSPILSLSNVPLTMNGYQFRCIVSGFCLPDAISNPATLSVVPKITAIAASISDCPGTLIVPLNVTHFIDVASFSLALKYDPGILNYSSYQNLNPALSGGSLAINSDGSAVYLSWTSTSPVTLGDDLLLDLVFTGITGYTLLDWDNETEGNCEFSNIDGTLFFDNYVNGDVTVYPPPAITSDPSNQTAPEGTSASFTVSATGTGLGYQWQESMDNGSSWNSLTEVAPFSGTSTPVLQILPVIQSMDGNQYRCVVSGTCPTAVISNAASLHAIPPIISTSINDVTNSCTANLIIPVWVNNCSNVGSISLSLNYDNTKLSFEGYQSANSELNSGMLIVNATSSQVILSWVSVNPANIGFGTLIEYRFKSTTGTSTSLIWDNQTPGQCEYSDPDGNLFATSFINAQLSVESNALIVDAGMDETISAGANVQLNGSVSGGTLPYSIQWTPVDGLSDPNILNPVASPANTTVYTLSVVDNPGCSGTDAMAVNVNSAGINVDVRVFLEGPFGSTAMSTLLNSNNYLPLDQPYASSPWGYSGSEHVASIPSADVVDWVLVELRDAPDAASAIPASMVERQAAFLLKNGHIVGLDGTSFLSFNHSVIQSLFVVVWHRNHLALMSSAALSNAGGVYSWDFTTASDKAYGVDAQKNLGGVFGMYAGDGDANGLIDTADKNIWGLEVGKKAYQPGDFDLNTQVSNQDKNDVWLINNTLGSQIPN